MTMALASPPPASAGPAAANTILSTSIKPADGTTGQTLTTGSGVKTGHIQNAAITAPKLGPGAVTTSAISDGAVTAAKILGPLPASLVSSTGLNADTVDGLHASSFALASSLTGYQRTHAQVIVVAADGLGQFVDPSAALASIIDASSSRPYLVKVMPGVYFPAGTISMKPFVDLEGSGRNLTFISAAWGGASNVLDLSASSEVRNLTIQGGGYWVVGGGGGLSASMRDVAVISSGAPNWAGDRVGIRAMFATLSDVSIVVQGDPGTRHAVGLASGGQVLLRSVKIDVAGGESLNSGVTFDGWTDADIQSSTIRASGASAVATAGYGVRIRDSVLSADTDGLSGSGTALHAGTAEVFNSELLASGAGAVAVRADAINGGVSIANSKVKGALERIGSTGAAYRCIGVFDAGFIPVTCP
jgi:hypothetical protein